MFFQIFLAFSEYVSFTLSFSVILGLQVFFFSFMFLIYLIWSLNRDCTVLKDVFVSNEIRLVGKVQILGEDHSISKVLSNVKMNFCGLLRLSELYTMVSKNISTKYLQQVFRQAKPLAHWPSCLFWPPPHVLNSDFAHVKQHPHLK
jgi:hypothetical protein